MAEITVDGHTFPLRRVPTDERETEFRVFAVYKTPQGVLQGRIEIDAENTNQVTFGKIKSALEKLTTDDTVETFLRIEVEKQEVIVDEPD